MSSRLRAHSSQLGRAVAAALLVVLVGCGGAAKPAEIPKLPPAKPEAVEALKDAARMWRLGPGNYERALERLKDALEIDPGLWEAWYDAGYIELLRHHTDEAIAALEKAHGILPTHAPTVAALGQAYLAAGRTADAVKVLRGFVEKQPNAKEANAARVQLANAQRRAKKLDEATETLRAVLRLEPRSAPALSALGMVYEARGQHDLADLVLHRALDIDKESKAAADVYNNLGLVALARRRDQEAFADFDQASRLDPALTVARRNKAMVYLDCGDYARASEELRGVTKAEPTDVEAWNALGVAERGQGKFDAAQKAYEKALAADPKGAGAADALFNLAVLQMDFKKDPAKARARLDEYLKAAAPNHPRRVDAEARARELAKQAPPPAQSKEAGGTS
ncbi:MAG: Tetratricopeptide 2 repeat protein [Myxococcales bacterium]|nr:Tetratricopeptide 2 repeat protein [Myxococcales bacterium]